MTTILHTFLSSTTLSGISYLIYSNAPTLIGFLHGPSAQLAALGQFQFTNVFLSQQDPSEDIIATTCDAYNTAYKEFAPIIRDAGCIASLFTILLIVLPNFLSHSYTKKQCLCFLVLLPLLSIVPALVGQILRESIPIELSLLEIHGLKRGLGMIEYCSFYSLTFEGAHGLHLLVYEMKVVGLAGGMLFLILGVVPVVK